MDSDTSKAALTSLIAWRIMTMVFLVIGGAFGTSALSFEAIIGR